VVETGRDFIRQNTFAIDPPNEKRIAKPVSLEKRELIARKLPCVNLAAPARFWLNTRRFN
jgi:hypothetical protein